MKSLHAGSIVINEEAGDVFEFVRVFEDEKVHVYLNFGEEVKIKGKGEVLMQNLF